MTLPLYTRTIALIGYCFVFLSRGALLLVQADVLQGLKCLGGVVRTACACDAVAFTRLQPGRDPAKSPNASTPET